MAYKNRFKNFRNKDKDDYCYPVLDMSENIFEGIDKWDFEDVFKVAFSRSKIKVNRIEMENYIDELYLKYMQYKPIEVPWY